jgi:hypothetical protein
MNAISVIGIYNYVDNHAWIRRMREVSRASFTVRERCYNGICVCKLITKVEQERGKREIGDDRTGMERGWDAVPRDTQGCLRREGAPDELIVDHCGDQLFLRDCLFHWLIIQRARGDHATRLYAYDSLLFLCPSLSRSDPFDRDA